MALLPAGEKGATASVFIVGVGDKEGAEAFLTKIAPPGKTRDKKVGDATVRIYPGGFAAS